MPLSPAKVAPGGEGGMEEVALLEGERSAAGLLMEPGITTATFYRGDCAAAKPRLLAQLQAVVAANPWLCGHLAKGAQGTTVLRHPRAPSLADVNAVFSETMGHVRTRGASFVETCGALFKTGGAVPSGNECVGKPAQKLSQLSVAECPGEDGTFCVVFSLCHGIADGRTYYEVSGARPATLPGWLLLLLLLGLTRPGAVPPRGRPALLAGYELR